MTTDAPSNIAVRLCSDIEDASMIADIGAKTFIETFGYLYAPEDLAAFLAQAHSPDVCRKLIADPEYGVWLATNAASVGVGYAVAGPCRLPVADRPANAGELKRLYVRQNLQSVGVGGDMMARALEWLGARFSHIYLGVYAENTDAQRFYARYGFGKVGEYVFMVGDHPDCEWIMKRKSQPRG